MIARISINVADVRQEPSHRSERISQGLYNEIVIIQERGKGFSRVKFPDGYIGWMGNQFLSENSPDNGEGPYIVHTLLAGGLERPDIGSRKVALFPYGCRLYGQMEIGFLNVQSERYGDVFVPEADLIDMSGIVPPANIESDDILLEAEKFMGVPYLWGGRSSFGVDCSGFVKTIMARFGVELPRDTKDQIKSGTEIPRGEVGRGDLLFFPRHVALAVSRDLFLHSSRSNGGVAFNSFDRGSRIYGAELDKSFLSARRVFN